jgi:DNA-binding response OmpR family regulator
MEEPSPLALCRRLGFDPPPGLVVVVDAAAGRVTSIALNGRPLLLGASRADPAPPEEPDADGRWEVTIASASTADGRIRIDTRRRVVEHLGEELNLPRLEFDLLAYLMARPGEAISRAELLERVWRFPSGGTATITVHIRHLRQRLEADPSKPVHLVTVRGVGYRFDP